MFATCCAGAANKNVKLEPYIDVTTPDPIQPATATSPEQTPATNDHAFLDKQLQLQQLKLQCIREDLPRLNKELQLVTAKKGLIEEGTT